MKVEREVVIDLLPVYFSGEASPATRALVEDYFRHDPDFEKIARGASRPLESLKVPSSSPNDAQEKLALERARQVMQTRSSFLWLAVCSTLMLFLFRIHDHKFTWLLWNKEPLLGLTFTAVAFFLWLLYFHLRRRKEPMPAQSKTLWLAVFYSLLPLLFRVEHRKVIFIFLDPDPTVGLIFGALAFAMWINYFVLRWRMKRAGC